MATIDHLVQDFLAQKIIAVVGVSDTRETGANRNYRTFKQHGYRVYAVNPRISTFDGSPCYPDLKSIPEKWMRCSYSPVPTSLNWSCSSVSIWGLRTSGCTA